MTGGHHVWTFPLSSLLRIQAGPTPETSLSSVPEMGKMKIWILLSRSTGLGSKEIRRHNYAFKLMKGKKNTSEWDRHTLWLSDYSVRVRVCVCVCVCVCGGSAFGWQIGSKLFTKRQYLCYWTGTKNVSKDVPRWNLLFMKWVTVTLLFTWSLCQQSPLCSQLPNCTNSREQSGHLPWSLHHTAFSPFSGPAQALSSAPFHQIHSALPSWVFESFQVASGLFKAAFPWSCGSLNIAFL